MDRFVIDNVVAWNREQLARATRDATHPRQTPVGAREAWRHADRYRANIAKLTA